MRKIRQDQFDERTAEIKARIEFKRNFGKLSQGQKAFITFMIVAWGGSLLVYLISLIPKYKDIIFEPINKLL